jgi:trimethylamine:corrinoid methyltransferase-like protein
LWTNRLPRLDVLSEEQAEAIHEAALTLLQEIGVRFAFEPALHRFRDTGVAVEDDLVRLDRGCRALAQARASSAHARALSVLTIGGDTSRSRRPAARRSSSTPTAAAARRRPRTTRCSSGSRMRCPSST